MVTLEDYLGEDYRFDRQEIDTLDRHIRLVAATFSHTFAVKQWPYEFRTTDTDIPAAKISQGTLAMSATAVGRLIGVCRGGPPRPLDGKVLKDHWDTAIVALADDLKRRRSSRRGENPANVHSSTFGDNNALTLSHITELLACLPANQKSIRIKLTAAVAEAYSSVLQSLSQSVPSANLLAAKDGRYQKNAFVPVRGIRACRDLDPNVGFGNLKPFFESGLHDQLSFSAIPDSRFDPAEMLFCLEGLLLCDPESVECTVFERVLEVLRLKQDTSAHWRPNKPFLASSTGHIVLPLSVEGANSLIRSVKIMDRSRSYDLFASKSMPLLRRFWNWLVARALHFDRGGEPCIGWHSEHVNEPDLVHIWDTCLVTDFMIGYRELLAKHIAHRTLKLSGVRVREPRPLAATLSERPDGARLGWSDVVEDREPILGATDTVYQQIGNKFVEPRLGLPGERSYSMLLYGPPGTGKTTLAELIADTLGWPLLMVTVSDFLGSGGALVEARAKAIFSMLESQRDVVILFDEIDSFLLDRDSKFYREQETLFKFLTPGMLTKINDLRAKRASIFIIATNYANRIDPAIKRIGRIDSKLLLLPPDLARRRAMLDKALVDAAKRHDGLVVPPSSEIDAAARAALYLGWSDISAAVSKWAATSTDMAETLKAAERSTGPQYYGRRFPAERPFRGQPSGEEARALYVLASEVGESQGFKDTFVSAAIESAGSDGASVQAEAEQLVNSF